MKRRHALDVRRPTHTKHQHGRATQQHREQAAPRNAATDGSKSSLQEGVDASAGAPGELPQQIVARSPEHLGQDENTHVSTHASGSEGCAVRVERGGMRRRAGHDIKRALQREARALRTTTTAEQGTSEGHGDPQGIQVDGKHAPRTRRAGTPSPVAPCGPD